MILLYYFGAGVSTNKKVTNLSAILSLICLFSIIWNLCIHIILWWVGSFTVGGEGLSVTPNNEWQNWKWLGFSVSFVSTILFVIALNNLRIFFREYKLGHYFSDKSTKSFHRFSWFLLATSISIPLLQGLNSFLKSRLVIGNGAEANISFSSDHMNYIVVSLVFLSISWLMHEATHLKNENSSFV